MLETGFDEIDEVEGVEIKMEDEVELDTGYVQEELQGMKPTSVDIVICIDITGSMSAAINNVKELSKSFFEDLIEKLRVKKRIMKKLRVKVIGFRDFYCDGDQALEESEFFELPKETEKFCQFVDSFEAKGGGDFPESSLEALALAMKSDWVKVDYSKETARHIIILFTDAPAHKLEKAESFESLPKSYPSDMLKNYDELYAAWNGQAGLDSSVGLYQMDQKAKRLILFVPYHVPDNVKERNYPWDNIQDEFDFVYGQEIEFDKGGKEMNKDVIVNNVAGTIC